MRWLLFLGVLVGCMADEQVGPDLPQPLDVVWTQTIHRGDMFTLVPGTGAADYLGAPIEALGGPDPLVDVLTHETVAQDATVFEEAIAAAHRAGITNAELEAGAVTFGLWGAGFTKLESFDYLSYERIRIHVEILGGQNSCATGHVIDNLFKYNAQNAHVDARDLYARLRVWLAAHPATAPRNILFASHSWGGAVAEYLALNSATIASDVGSLVDGAGVAPMAFTIAAGVPGFVLDYSFAGPGMKFTAEGRALYEIDRPDDPVHTVSPSGNGAGHVYAILFGDVFQGFYGITTTELSCARVPGPCITLP